MAVLFIGVFLLAQALASTMDWWISFWTAQEEMRTQEDQNTLGSFDDTVFDIVALSSNQTESNYEGLGTDWCASIYGALMGFLIVVAIVRSVFFMELMFKSSQTLHDGMFNGIVAVSIASTRFFGHLNSFFYCFRHQ